MHETPAYEIRDLTEDDLEGLAWSGSPTHVRYVAAALERANAGEVVFLVAVSEGESVAVGAADLTQVVGSAKFWMLTVHPERRSQGFGTALLRALEERVRERGFNTAVLSVEKSNVRAKALYERLDWELTGSMVEGWDQETLDGRIQKYVTECWVMTKDLAL